METTETLLAAHEQGEHSLVLVEGCPRCLEIARERSKYHGS